jgi:hypothetical protein
MAAVRAGCLFIKNSRHGFEMGVFSQQWENPGFKVLRLFQLLLLIRDLSTAVKQFQVA